MQRETQQQQKPIVDNNTKRRRRAMNDFLIFMRTQLEQHNFLLSTMVHLQCQITAEEEECRFFQGHHDTSFSWSLWNIPEPDNDDGIPISLYFYYPQL